MSRNFYEGKDADIVSGSATFSSAIALGFATYGLTSAQSTAFGALNTTLQAAYLLSNAPATRTTPTIAATRQAIKNMRANAVLLAKIIYATPTVTDSQLVTLGLKPRASRTPIPVPSTPPTVEVLSVSGRLVNIRVHDLDSERRGIPFGARGANLFSFVGAEAPTDPRQYHYEGVTTRAKAQIIFPDSVVSGALVWLSASWVSARGQVSIGSTPISFTLQGGAIPAAA